MDLRYNSAVLLNPRASACIPTTKFTWCRSASTFRCANGSHLPEAHRRHSDFTPGTEYRVGAAAGGTFGTFICYEAIFPDEIRRFTANGAELLINISNDGWFGRSAAPAQHLMMARVRAVENRRWLLRDTNNGFTVSVDPYGRIVARIADRHPRPTRSAVRFPQRPHALRPLRRLVRLALRPRIDRACWVMAIFWQPISRGLGDDDSPQNRITHISTLEWPNTSKTCSTATSSPKNAWSSCGAIFDAPPPANN